MEKRIRVGVVFGGQSGEHEVSLKSAQSVQRALADNGFEVVPIGITKAGYWLTQADSMNQLLREADPSLIDTGIRNSEESAGKNITGVLFPDEAFLKSLDVIFPVLHGPYGEDGTIQGLLEMAHVPYVGCGVLASSVAMDKILFKHVMRAVDIPVLPCIAVSRKAIASEMDSIVDRVQSRFDWPVFCKPSNMGSSVGITMCRSAQQLRRGLAYAAEYDSRVLIEKGLQNAREIEVSILGNAAPRASVPGEIIPNREFYDYKAKYLDTGADASRLIIPAPVSPSVAASCRDYAVRAFSAIDGSGLSRVDFLIDQETEQIYLNEINTLPGFTSISMYPKLWEATGISFQELVGRLVDLAMDRFRERIAGAIRYIPEP